MRVRVARRQTGMSLVECLFALLILASLLALSAPALASLIEATHAGSAHASLVTSLNLARATAITLHRDVVMCPSRDHQRCDDSTWWHGGWIVFQDSNGNRKRDAGEPVLESVAAQPRVAIATTAGRKLVRFRADGSATGTDLTYTVCDHRGAAASAAVVVNNPGRIRSGKSDLARVAQTCAGLDQ